MSACANNSQLKLPNQRYRENRSEISAMTELAILPVPGVNIHTAQYMFATLCALHAVPRACLTSKLKQFGIDINVNTHNKSNSDYEKNNNKIIYNKIEKTEDRQRVNDELRRKD